MISYFENDKILEHLQTLIETTDSSGQTEQLFIVVDDFKWWRLYRNFSTKNWEVSMHTEEGWGSPAFLPTSKLIFLLQDYKEELLNIRGFEYKTFCRSIIYKSSDVSPKA